MQVNMGPIGVNEGIWGYVGLEARRQGDGRKEEGGKEGKASQRGGGEREQVVERSESHPRAAATRSGTPNVKWSRFWPEH